MSIFKINTTFEWCNMFVRIVKDFVVTLGKSSCIYITSELTRLNDSGEGEGKRSGQVTDRSIDIYCGLV